MNRLNLFLVLALLSSSLMAESGEKKDAKKNTKKPVQDAPKVQQGYVPRSDITITEGKDRLIKEYRINGQLRAVKVTPTNGFPPYYLIDREGNGQFFRLGPDMGEEVVVPNWIIIEW